jgi:uncharacterized membrane protein HdeD (DUF308 family)
MFDELVRRWWIVAARGAVSLAFGVAAFVAPDRTMALLVSLFGLFALADGLFTMGAGLAVNWLSLFLEGFVGGAIGLLTLFFPSTNGFWLVPLIATYAIVTGGLELAGAVRFRRIARGAMVQGDRLLGVSGAISLAFGVLFWGGSEAAPATFNTAAQIYLVGGFAFVSGLLLLAFAFNVRGWRAVLGSPIVAAR